MSEKEAQESVQGVFERLAPTPDPIAQGGSKIPFYNTSASEIRYYLPYLSDHQTELGRVLKTFASENCNLSSRTSITGFLRSVDAESFAPAAPEVASQLLGFYHTTSAFGHPSSSRANLGFLPIR